MLGIYLQPDSVKVVQGRLRKDNLLNIKNYQELKDNITNIKSYIKILMNFNDETFENDANDFANLFHEIKNISNYKRESIYLVLPDFLFNMIDCFSYDKDIELEGQIKSFLNIELDQIYFSTPIFTNPAPQENCVTVYSIRRDLVDLIIKAAELAHVRLASIEAASISFLRASGIFQKEEFVFQGFEKQATMIGYSSIAGLFAMNTPELALTPLTDMDRERAETLIKTNIIQFESTAEQTFSNINDDIAITLLADPVLIEGFNSFKERKAKRQKFADYIISDINENEQQDWMPVVGTLLQSVEFPNLKYGNMMLIDDYERILSGNILPAEIQKSSKTYQFLSKLKQFSLISSIVLSIIFFVELIGIFALSTVEIPAELEQEYQEAQENNEQLDTEIQILNLATKEHQYPLYGMKAVLDNKPNELKFLTAQIGGEGKNIDANWIKLKVTAQDPLLFQTYLSSLQEDKRFKNVVISEINSNDSAGIKTANIILSKGQITEGEVTE